jgi:hypothetical protein
MVQRRSVRAVSPQQPDPRAGAEGAHVTAAHGPPDEPRGDGGRRVEEQMIGPGLEAELAGESIADHRMVAPEPHG